METKKKKGKTKLIIFVLKKLINPKTLIPLVVTLSVNTYAWFIFSTKVETGINAKVRAWNILFETKDNQVVEHLRFEIDEIYPGMNTYTDHATVKNSGDGDAILSFKVEKIRVLGNEYSVDDITYTSDGLILMLQEDYPFKVSLSLTNDLIASHHEESFVIEVSWPYESGDDLLDTYWGMEAYTYNSANPDSSSILLDIILEVNQATE